MMRAMLRNMTRFDRLCCVFVFFFFFSSFALRVGVLMRDSMMLNRFPVLRCSGHNILQSQEIERTSKKISSLVSQRHTETA